MESDTSSNFNRIWFEGLFLFSGEVLGFGMGSCNQLSQGNDDDCVEPTKFTGKQLAERSVRGGSLGGQHTLLLATPKQV